MIGEQPEIFGRTLETFERMREAYRAVPQRRLAALLVRAFEDDPAEARRVAPFLDTPWLVHDLLLLATEEGPEAARAIEVLRTLPTRFVSRSIVFMAETLVLEAARLDRLLEVAATLDHEATRKVAEQAAASAEPRSAAAGRSWLADDAERR
jgi:hypothetical protein